MFILDAIQCAAEEALMFAEEKAALWQEERCIKRMSRREEEEQETEENPVEEDETADNSLDDFDEYLRESALGVLAPFGMKNDEGFQGDETKSDKISGALGEEPQKELKDIMQLMIAKLSEEDKKEIMDSLKSKNLSTDMKGLLGIQDEN